VLKSCIDMPIFCTACTFRGNELLSMEPNVRFNRYFHSSLIFICPFCRNNLHIEGLTFHILSDINVNQSHFQKIISDHTTCVQTGAYKINTNQVYTLLHCILSSMLSRVLPFFQKKSS